MSKGKAKMEISDILNKLEYGDITFCIAGREIAKVLDKIYTSLCEQDCKDDDPCNTNCN